MQIEDRIAQNHAEFQHLLDAAEKALATADINGAISATRQAATLAWNRSCGIFASPRLEALLARIGRAIPSAASSDREIGGQRRIATVVTQAYSVGDHTKIACRWVALDKHATHTMVLTSQGNAPIPSVVNDLVEQGKTALCVLEQESDIGRVHALREQLAQADLVVLHIHPNDPLPVVALAGMDNPPPVVLEDHANHVFWIGASVANLVAGLHGHGIRIATARRGISPTQISWLRTPVDFDAPLPATEIDIRAKYGIPMDAPLLASCGAAYQYAPIDGQSLAALLAPMLEERTDLHLLLVGPSVDPPGTSLSTDFPGRVHLAGVIDQQDVLKAIYLACDVYLDAFPFGSGSMISDAIAAGKPVLRFCPQDWSDSGFSVNSSTLPMPLYVWHEAEAFREALRELLDSPSLRTERSELFAQIVRLLHDEAHFQGQLDELYARASRLPRIEIDPDVAAQKAELLDTLLDKLSDNRMMAWRKETGGDLAWMLATPQERYHRWLGSQRLPAARVAAARARIPDGCNFHVLLAGTGDAEQLKRTLHSLASQSLPAQAITVIGEAGMPLPDHISVHPSSGAGWSEIFNDVTAASTAEWVLPLEAGDVLAEDALLLLADQSATNPELTCCYADEDTWLLEGPVDPIFKPDINLDLLRSYPYVGRMLVMRRQPLLALGGLQPQAGAMAAYAHVFRCIEQFGLHTIGHVAEPILHASLPFGAWLAAPDTAPLVRQALAGHLERLGVAHEIHPGVLAGSHRVVYLHHRRPPVSIIIPTRDQLPMLNGLIDSLLAKTSYRNYELLIVDNDSRDPAACAYLDGIERLNNPQLRVLRWPHPFNYSAINNFAAAQARGEYLILLNNDTAILHAEWIEALLNHAQRPEVGIVGAKLHFPDGRIQHGGVLLGMNGPADHPYVGEAMDAPGYMHRLQVDQNYTAVTAACMMIRKSVYEEVGGLDELNFKVSYNDVDLCLRTKQAGYLIVWTPYAKLMHESNVSQKVSEKTARAANVTRFQCEQATMYRKWLPLLARDPAYNRNLSLTPPGFDLDPIRTAAWQPLLQPALPRIFCVAADETGCGHYRVMQPYLSMEREGLAEGMIAPAHLPPVMLERFAPSSLILQRQHTDGQLKTMRAYHEFSRAFKVYELDDYIPNVPLKSLHRASVPKDIMKSLRKAVALTDRFVVSTEPLAEAFADLHDDIRVVHNRLPVNWWEGLRGERRKSAKPRVGWGGGSSHRGDLELIADVVRDLAKEVEWVFFGMCPEKLRPYVHEFHNGVPIGQYPATLAALNLDLALAPLEDNLFNACKSNLRLLEYGACGFPVICSDIVCYRGDLPVTRVRNRYKEWVDAIRMHISDLDATAKTGDALREVIIRDWMLTGDNLATWRDAWLPD